METRVPARGCVQAEAGRGMYVYKPWDQGCRLAGVPGVGTRWSVCVGVGWGSLEGIVAYLAIKVHQPLLYHAEWVWECRSKCGLHTAYFPLEALISVSCIHAT